MTQPSAGWFPDPTDPSRQRYFDGSVWTENYAPLSTQPPGSDLPVKPGMSKGAKIVLGVVGGILALSVLSSIGSGADKNNVSLARVMGPPDCQGDGTTVARY